MKVFVDTSAFLAILNRNDQYHQTAIKVWEEILSSKMLLFCSNYVLVETLAILQNRFGIESVLLFEHNIQPILEIIWIDVDIHRQGMGILLSAGRRKLSLVDCTSFETIRIENMDKVFTFDPHFAEQGFDVVPA
jgi:predicted nucleic acid-binding protein